VNSKIQKSIYVFGLSLVANYFLIYFLTLIGIYHSVTIYAIIIIELGLLLVYFNKISTKDNLNIRNYYQQIIGFFKSKSLLYNLCFVFSSLVIGYYTYLFLTNFGTIFSNWDAIVSWNRWAIDWSNNFFPRGTWHYPQLIPANWSLTYVIMQNNDIQFFAKAIMSLFPIAILLLFMDLALTSKKSVYFIGLILYGLLLRTLYSPSFIVDGYVDIAVSFFSFLAFYTIVQNDGLISKKNIILVLIFGSAAAVTKQAGIFMLAITIGWCIWVLYKIRKELSFKDLFKIISLLLFVMLAFLSWYLYKQIQITKGLDSSEISWVTQGIYKGIGYFERLVNAITKIQDLAGPILFYFILCATFLSLFDKKARWVTFSIVIPYFLIWGFFFSYDHRNFALVIPFIAYASAFGFFLLKELKRTEIRKKLFIKLIFLGLILFLFGLLVLTNNLVDKSLLSFISFIKNKTVESDWPAKLNTIGSGFLAIGLLMIFISIFNFLSFRLKVAAVFILIFIIMNFTIFNKSMLMENQRKQQILIGDSGLNNLLYEYDSKYGVKGKIYTDYQLLGALPGLKKHYQLYQNEISIPFLQNLTNKKDVYYLLLPEKGVLADIKINSDAVEYIEKKIVDQEYTLIFKKENSYSLIQIRR
jgi:hypothetical protein